MRTSQPYNRRRALENARQMAYDARRKTKNELRQERKANRPLKGTKPK